MNRTSRCFLLCFILLASTQSIGQTLDTLRTKRKTVGLVLSGGGAKGLAHIGVIKYLEEHHIPIDYICGSSMGAIVGGFYAAGYRVDEMEAMANSSEFQSWVSGKLGNKDKHMYANTDDDASFFSFQVNLDSNYSPTLQARLANDELLNFALAERLYQASGKANYNFDSLPIPFRAIGADVFTQSTVSVKKGQLSDALRASMTIPFVYKPIKVNGKYLFDGGLYNNFPVSVMRKEFNPDIIIGVNVASKQFKSYPYEKDDELIDGFVVYLFDNADVSQLNKGDIYVEPKFPIDGYAGFSFDQASVLINSGYEAAASVADSIETVFASMKTIPVERRPNLPDFKEKNIRGITVRGLTRDQQSFVRRVFKHRKESLSMEQVKRGYYGLISHDYFSGLYPSFVKTDTSDSYRLLVDISKDKKIRASLGGNLASRNISTGFVSVKFNFLKQGLYGVLLNAYTGRFYQSVKGVFRANFPTQIPMFIESFVVYNSWDYFAIEELILKKNTNPAAFISRVDRSAGARIGLSVGKRSHVGAIASYINNEDGYINTSSFNNDDKLDQTQFDALALTIQFQRNTLDKKMFASEGLSAKISAKYISGTETHLPGTTSVSANRSQFWRDWFVIDGSYEHYFGTKLKWGLMIDGALSNMPNFKNYTATLLYAPSFYPLIDSRTIFFYNYKGKSYLAGGLKGIWPITENIEARVETYAFVPFKRIMEGEGQTASLGKPFSHLDKSASLSAIYHSPLGPVSATITHYDDEVHPWGFLFNIGFLIFNNKGLEE